jgi:ribosome-associated protein
MPVEVMSGVQIPERELHFHFSRSGGPGGQNVNKVATRVELRFSVNGSPSLSDEQKGRIHAKLGARIDTEGWLHVASQESRSQWKTRDLAIKKFVLLLRLALVVKKKRTPSKPTRISKESRVSQKKVHSAKKRLRSKVSHFDE